MGKDEFEAVNGFSNRYWGWGVEDDEFYARMKDAHMKVTRPGNLSTGTKDSFKHIHDKVVRKRDMYKCFNQREVTRRRDRVTGMDSLNYTLTSRSSVVIEDAHVTILNIMLHCDRSLTPWCTCADAPNVELPTRKAKTKTKH